MTGPLAEVHLVTELGSGRGPGPTTCSNLAKGPSHSLYPLGWGRVWWSQPSRAGSETQANQIIQLKITIRNSKTNIA